MAKCCEPKDVKIGSNKREIVGYYSIKGACEPCVKQTVDTEVKSG